MERAQRNYAKHWGLFAISLIGMLVLMFSPYGQWFWLILPLVCTQFALAMDLL